MENPDFDDLPIIARSYINGKWTPYRKELSVLNPFTNKEIGFMPLATNEELERAVTAANAAFKVWGRHDRWSWVMRSEIFRYLAELFRDYESKLAHLITLETGKHINEAREEVNAAIVALELGAAYGRGIHGQKLASKNPKIEHEVNRKPKGVCTVITPFNFPLMIPAQLLTPPLVCGNPVIWKPSEETPLTATFFMRLFDIAAKKFNLPGGILNLVHGHGSVAEYLVRHKGTVGQIFTGSSQVGRHIREICGSYNNKFAVCEMGGKNSLIVLGDADIDRAVELAKLSAYKTTHQRCTSADIIIVERSIEREFTEKFIATTKALKFGDPFDSNVFAGPLINRKAVEKFFHYGEAVLSDGAEALVTHLPCNSRTNVVYPNVFRMEYKKGMNALRYEAFTPNIVIVPADNFNQAMDIANDTEYGLVISILTNNYKKMREFKMRADSGVQKINLPTVGGGEGHIPFGGIKASGTGMPGAGWLYKYMCHETVFSVNYE